MTKRKRRPHGFGTVFRRGATFTIAWYEGGRRRTCGGYISRDLAQRVLAKKVSDAQLRRSGLPPDPSTMPTLNEAAQPWLDRRTRTHRTADDDAFRWKKHLDPFFGHLHPADVDAARIKDFIHLKRDQGLSPATVRLLVMLLSSLFVDLVEQGHAAVNPARALPKSTKWLIRPDHDPRTTPFVERLEDVRRIYFSMEEPVSIAYALGALAGLRTGEVLALRWDHIDLGAHRIHVRESARGPLKDKESRVVVMMDTLRDVLAAWKLRTGGAGLIVPPMRSDGRRLDAHTLGTHLRAALVHLRLPRLTWYQATRHTFASHWVMQGGSIERLREMMGHCSVLVTERYAHLRHDLFGDQDRGRFHMDLKPGTCASTPVVTATAPA